MTTSAALAAEPDSDSVGEHLASPPTGRDVLDPLVVDDADEPLPGDYLGGLTDDVEIDAVVTSPDVLSAEKLSAAGAKTIGPDGPSRTIIRAKVGALRSMLRNGDITTVEQLFTPDPKAVTEGRAVTNAHAWHQAGLKGQGIRIGVVDVGFDGYASLLGSDLPASVATKTFHASGIEAGSNESSDKHGTAVAEIVHDMAPSAQLYLINFDSIYDFPAVVDYLIANDIDVVNASIGTEIGPLDETTELSASVRTAVDSGITWVNSAGNEAEKHHGRSGVDDNANMWLDLSGADELGNFQVYNGATVPDRTHQLLLSWQDGNAPADLWLCIFKWDGAAWNPHQVNADATNNHCSKTNTLADRPRTRFAAVRNTSGAPEWYAYGIWRNAGSPVPARFDIFDPDRSAGIEELELNTVDRSLSEPGLVSKAITVGAYPSCAPTTIEPYSSHGPTILGEVKPDLVGAAIVSTAAYGPLSDSSTCTAQRYSGPFNGTSAASPHVAGLAALYLQASPGSSPASVKSALNGMAKDGDYGRNTKSNTFGWGVAQLSAPTADNVAPTWPNEVFRADVYERSLTLRWSAAKDDVGVTTYKVVQGPPQPSNGFWNGFVVAELGGSARSYTLGGLEPDVSHAYWIIAEDAAGNEGHGSVRVFTTATDFIDTGGSTFHDDIAWLSATGITKGCNPPLNDRFCPDDSVTRAQMASFVIRALGLPSVAGSDYFVDDDHSIHENDINAMAFFEITKGCGTELGLRLYCPDLPVTREQMASFLVRALGLKAGWEHDFFGDDNGSIHEFDINRLAFSKITKGCNPPLNSLFCPQDSITRGQMAAFLRRSADFINAIRSELGEPLLKVEDEKALDLPRRVEEP